MAEFNLCLVANRVLGLLRSEKTRLSRQIRSFFKYDLTFNGMENCITSLAPMLLDAEKESSKKYEIEKWAKDLSETLHEAENLLEEIKMVLDIEDMKARRSRDVGSSRKASNIVKKVAKKVRETVLISNSLHLQEPEFLPLITMADLRSIKDKVESSREAAQSWFDFSKLSEEGKILVFPRRAREEAASGLFSPVKKWDSRWDRDVEEVVDILLSDEERKVEILAIVGNETVEKGVFVRRVFEDKRVRDHFDLMIWVELDQLWCRDYVKVVLEEIVASSDEQSPRNKFDMDTLVRLVEKCLGDKRYLIVVPDSWTFDPQEMNSVLQSLPRGAPGSIIILVTTLFYKLVHDIGGAKRGYRLENLNQEEDLIKKMLFRQGIREPVIGSLHELVGQIKIAEEEEQIILSKNELSLLIDSYLFCYPSADMDFNAIYDRLPSPMRHCLAYCFLFPQHHEMDVQTLVKLWMAQGFIVPHDAAESDEDLEDIGYEYFLNLFKRNLFHEAKLDGRWRFTKCRLHPLVHNWSNRPCGQQCHLITRWTSEDQIYSQRVLHLSSISNSLFENKIHTINRGLRSLLFPVQRGTKPYDLITSDGWDKILFCFTYLRALDMHACGMKIVPYSIGKMKHLRYIDLSQNNDITEVPDSITKLLNLQTLKLSSCINLGKLPTDIGNLVNLRHLEIDGCYSLTSLPRGFGRLTNLRTLSQIILNKDTSKVNEELNELKQLVNLREVHIRNLRHDMGKKISTCLQALRRVRCLLLEWESRAPEFENIEARISIEQFLDLEELTLMSFRDINGMFSGTSVPRNLSKLVLRRCVKCRDLPALDSCFMLKVLVLDEMPDLEFITEESQVCPKLQELWLTELPKLKSWWKTSFFFGKLPLFPCLSKLVIEDCPNLASLPLFPALKEGLVLDSTSWKLFELTMKHKEKPHPYEASSSSSTSSSPPLSKLKALCIANIDELDDSKAAKIAWNTLKNLELLKLDFLQKVNTLPEGISELTKLKELHIWRWGGKEIPSWIEKLKSLEKLVIRVCPDLKTLPDEIKSLKCLRTLEIEDCETLLRRCEKEIGMDWYKISHIPERRLGQISKK